ncbi:MAG: hypothetical protein GY757_53045 [bacterium]|nr:hypothetical protein [bacterium]
MLELEAKGCKFVIWKSVSGQKINKNNVKNLISKGKSGKLKLVNNNGDYRIESKILGKCPVCKKGDITEGKKGFGCSSWRKEDGGCKFVIWKEICERETLEDEVIELITKGYIPKTGGFISKRTDKPFSAGLSVNIIKCKVDFVFEELQ